MNKPTIKKIIPLLTLLLLISCDSKLKGTWKCSGGMVDDLEFLNGKGY